MKNKIYHTVGKIPKSNIKIILKNTKLKAPTHKSMTTSLSWLGTDTSIKSA
jgi:hypothetical protein